MVYREPVLIYVVSVLVASVLKGLFGGEEVVFPVDTSRFGSTGLVAVDTTKDVEETKGGSLRAAPALKTGETFVSFDVDKWGLKDAEDYVDPRVTVCVFGALVAVWCGWDQANIVGLHVLSLSCGRCCWKPNGTGAGYPDRVAQAWHACAFRVPRSHSNVSCQNEERCGSRADIHIIVFFLP